MRIILLIILCLPLMPFCSEAAPESIRIGSKKFTESVILGEVLSGLLRHEGAKAEHIAELGGTRLLWEALLKGEISCYPEYSGTILEEILAGENISGEGEMASRLEQFGIRMSRPLGFNDTYALGIKAASAKKYGIRTISDLRKVPELRLGFSHEFMERGDGWAKLREAYGLPHTHVTGLEHELSYRALESGAVDLIDLYSTDAEIKYYGLKTLTDDLGFFPVYNALILYRRELAAVPEFMQALHRLEGKIPEAEMIALNARAKLDKVPEVQVAADFIQSKFAFTEKVESDSLWQRVGRRSIEHLSLVGVSLLAAILVGLPLGIISARHKRFSSLLLGAVGLIQTIPSLALLVFMILLLGIGAVPAVAALFLYSLLPIVRGTFLGLSTIPASYRESAEALGLPESARLRLVELPLASPSILSGIKTSAVINVGTATLGALIGAGGYGQTILTGIRLDNTALILEGAVPATLMALLVQGAFDIAERVFIPKGLR